MGEKIRVGWQKEGRELIVEENHTKGKKDRKSMGEEEKDIW